MPSRREMWDSRAMACAPWGGTAEPQNAQEVAF